MPRYDYGCDQCGRIEEHLHSMKEEPEIRCPDCGTVMKKRVVHNFAGFNIKGGSASIHWKEKRQRLKNREILGRKQKEKYGDGPKVTPNIAGVPQESWADCQKLAKECGLNADSYTPHVEKEKKTKPKGTVTHE